LEFGGGDAEAGERERERRRRRILSNLLGTVEKPQNSVCFDKKIIKSPTEIICLASLFMSYWAGLQNGSDKETLETGTAALKEEALAFHPQEEAHEELGAGVVLLQ
jgi:hypothetical protein